MGRTQVRGRLVIALAAVLVLVAACAEDEGPGATSAASGADAVATGPSSPTGSTGAAGTTPAGDDAGGGRYDYGTGGAGDDDGAEAGADVTLVADNFAFDPAEVELAAGAEITVENTNGGTPHTFTVEGTDIDLTLEPGAVATETADLDAGTYTFLCRFHPQMTGTLTIT